MSRPPVDVVVPFRGNRAELEKLGELLGRLTLGPGDSLVIVDNTPAAEAAGDRGAGSIPIERASGRATPGYARNRGAAGGKAGWIVFIDSDVIAPADLADLYFDPPPGDETGLLAGGIQDDAVPPHAPAVPRYSRLNAAGSQERTFGFGPKWGFPQTANVACRRAAFEGIGGFREDIRAGEDADLSYRLRLAGWLVERRESASVVHRSRPSVRAFARQRACYGSAAAWLDREYPGSFPPRRRAGLAWWGVRHATSGLLRAARARDRDHALMALLDPLEHLAYELGRSLPNERPLPRSLARLVRARDWVGRRRLPKMTARRLPCRACRGRKST